MGCNESKANVLKLTSNPQPEDENPTSNNNSANVSGRRNNFNVMRQASSSSLGAHLIAKDIEEEYLGSANSSGRGTKPQTPEESSNGGYRTGSSEPTNISATLANRIPSAYEQIPSSDLGDSLDVRKALRLFKPHQSSLGSKSARHKLPSLFDHQEEEDGLDETHHDPSSAHSTRSGDSMDSGISDPGEDYSFVITENSPEELVKRVEKEFMPVENINLVITGKAVPRMLSGYQKARLEEQAILDSLRDEGFIATGRTKASGGLSFEVIEASPQVGGSASSTSSKPQDFLPLSAMKKLDERRNRFGPGEKSSADLEKRRAEADERRQAELVSRKEKMAELSKGRDVEARKNEVRQKIEDKKDAALQKRETHLKELRDKLKAQNQRAQQIKLKQLINKPPVPVPMSASATGDNNTHNNNIDYFFD